MVNMAKQIIRRAVQPRHVNDATMHIAHQLLGMVVDSATGQAVPSEHIALVHEHGVLSFSAVEPVTDQEFLDFASPFGEVLLARRFGSAEDAKIFGSDSSFVHPVVIREPVTGAGCCT